MKDLEDNMTKRGVHSDDRLNLRTAPQVIRDDQWRHVEAATANHAHKASIEWLITDVFNTGKVAALDQVAAHNLCVYYPQASEPLCGLAQVKQAFSRARAAFPDVYVMTEDTIAAGDRVVTRWTARATHIGLFWGIEPTARPILWTGATIYRFVADTIAEIWVYADALQLLQQLDSTRIPVSRSG
jgi:predicted ester cyclase